MIREVKYPKWLANVVVVQKKNGKWRVCVDFTDLNKACPKDPFPLPHIESMVDAAAGHELLTFMDASSGFQQIQMEPSDQEDTSFMTLTGIYCYISMPFGLRNAGATYQRLVNMMFKDQLGDTMEVYIDDMVVKSERKEDHLQDLEVAFNILDRYNMKLNPSKCHFVVKAGKFLGYVVTKRGIEANPEQIKAIINLKPSRNVKDVQRLTGRVAALNRFISKSSEKCKEFYDILRKNRKFEWIEKHEVALKDLKDYLSSAPTLMKPNVLRKPELSGRIVKWAVKLRTYDIKYEPRNEIKSQALADFVADFTSNLQVPGEENAWADSLANLALSMKIPEDLKIPIIHIIHPAIDERRIMEIDSGNQLMDPSSSQAQQGSWIQPIRKYIEEGEIPIGENRKSFRINVSLFIISNNILYRKSLAGPYLRCIEEPEVQEVLKDFHEGDCGNHTGGRSLFSRILRTRYFWPTMKRDSMDYTRKCDVCQRYSNTLHQPAEPLYPIVSSWPFTKWGMDIVGKLPKALGGKVFTLAMTDYFSRWIEAESFAQVKEMEFIRKRNTKFCDSWGIKMITFIPVHPQANGQAESSNKVIIKNLKKKLGSKKGRWAEELPYVLWADRTTLKNATCQTPFSLNTTNPADGKLAPKWEGSYLIEAEAGK
ncbi:hypothetical protein QVD17_41591 [Tagetes erecta]|uniref:Uncharacterized protein n=1 Tax=Tagetes erecta TaxID=13708 RepID=A0AAD8JM39_TARER|nr:hypothetical protein QVD17_41591 [Tagetes erecta]